MRILALADEESEYYYNFYTPGKLDEFDLILSCGDLPKSYLEFFVTLARCPLLYVRGNHDEMYEENPPEGSYTSYLFEKGLDKILKKVGEECTEIVIAAKNPDPEEIKYEIADFLYHAMVLMVEKGVTWDEIKDELARRE